MGRPHRNTSDSGSPGIAQLRNWHTVRQYVARRSGLVRIETAADQNPDHRKWDIWKPDQVVKFGP